MGIDAGREFKELEDYANADKAIDPLNRIIARYNTIGRPSPGSKNVRFEDRSSFGFLKKKLESPDKTPLFKKEPPSPDASGLHDFRQLNNNTTEPVGKGFRPSKTIQMSMRINNFSKVRAQRSSDQIQDRSPSNGSKGELS